METKVYNRKPFSVHAIQMTAENAFDIAEWCRGEVRKDSSTQQLYVKVNVIKPADERQTQAHIGDWVLRSGNSFKVYSNKAFNSTFELANVQPAVSNS